MKPGRALLAVGLILASCLAAAPALRGLRGTESLPDALSSQEFWSLSGQLSEADGSFRSDNLLSNEAGFPFIIAELGTSIPRADVYVGVGPEQNFNYMAALRPKMAFIVDVRRGNLDLHLMYKALFDLSRDRADFVSRLFSTPRPSTLDHLSTPEQIFQAFGALEKDESLYHANLDAIEAHLLESEAPGLARELEGVENVYAAFYRFGPDIRYSSNQGGAYGGYNQPSYAELMKATDADGRPRSYLASEEGFRALQDLERKNLIVPVVGDFGGPKAIRAIGQYLRDRGATVSAFYVSNVEMYLNQQDLWSQFCRNVAALPVDDTSIFIRASRGDGYGRRFGLSLSLGDIRSETRDCR